MTGHATAEGYEVAGWSFRRGDGGTVEIVAERRGDQPARRIAVEPATWAEIVAAVSVNRHDPDAYHRALGLHSGEAM